MKGQLRAGYLLMEYLVVLALVSVIGLGIAWQGEKSWTAFRLHLATQQVVGMIHQAQSISRGSAGTDVGIFRVHGRKRQCEVWQGLKLVKRQVLPEGISFASPNNYEMTFQEYGRVVRLPGSTYQIVLGNRHGLRKRIIISAQTGRVRIAS